MRGHEAWDLLDFSYRVWLSAEESQDVQTLIYLFTELTLIQYSSLFLYSFISDRFSNLVQWKTMEGWMSEFLVWTRFSSSWSPGILMNDTCSTFTEVDDIKRATCSFVFKLLVSKMVKVLNEQLHFCRKKPAAFWPESFIRSTSSIHFLQSIIFLSVFLLSPEMIS